MFYGGIGFLIGVVTGATDFSIKELFFSLVPFFRGKRWFVETYIILVLLAPFINKMLCTLDKKSFCILLTIQIMIFSVWYSVGLSSPVLDDGYGIINFIVLYTFGAYCRLFQKESRLLKISKSKLLLGYGICSATTFALSLFVYPFGYSFITNVVGSALLFCFFAKLEIGCNKKINTISEAVFDVYFIHSDMYTSNILIYELLQGKIVAGSMWMMPHLVFTIVAIYILGMLAFRIRNFMFAISVNRILDRIRLINKNQTI